MQGRSLRELDRHPAPSAPGKLSASDRVMQGRSLREHHCRPAPSAPGDLSAPPLALFAAIARADFDRWIEDELAAIDDVVDGVLARGGVAAGAIQRVFATGGSSLVPAVHARLAARFGADRVVGGDELTSVAWGLAARARAVFA